MRFMSISSEDLLADLQRLADVLGRVLTANDVIRDGEYSVNTYYKRFGHQWRAVEEAFEEWQATGDSPVDDEQFDWRSLHDADVD